jgi:hypothetical protein
MKILCTSMITLATSTTLHLCDVSTNEAANIIDVANNLFQETICSYNHLLFNLNSLGVPSGAKLDILTKALEADGIIPSMVQNNPSLLEAFRQTTENVVDLKDGIDVANRALERALHEIPNGWKIIDSMTKYLGRHK